MAVPCRGAGYVADGGLAAKARVQGHRSFGSGQPVHEPRLESFLREYGLEGSMSRRGNCHDNAVAESFFQLLKRERLKKKIYTSRDAGRADIFDHIEMYYSSRGRHSSNERLSPVWHQRRHQERLVGSV